MLTLAAEARPSLVRHKEWSTLAWPPPCSSALAAGDPAGPLSCSRSERCEYRPHLRRCQRRAPSTAGHTAVTNRFEDQVRAKRVATTGIVLGLAPWPHCPRKLSQSTRDDSCRDAAPISPSERPAHPERRKLARPPQRPP